MLTTTEKWMSAYLPRMMAWSWFPEFMEDALIVIALQSWERDMGLIGQTWSQANVREYMKKIDDISK